MPRGSLFTTRLMAGMASPHYVTAGAQRDTGEGRSGGYY